MAATKAPPNAAVVTVGDELLLGRTVDTNAAWLARALSARGLAPGRHETVRDDRREIEAAVARALGSADLVVVTGGLGPTPDDVTRDAVAALLGAPLREDPEVLENIRARFEERGILELPAPNRRVAQVPEGARKLGNPVGTAPGLALKKGGALVVLLPGVPREMMGIVQGSDFDAALAAHFGDRLEPVWMRMVHTTGIPESLLSAQVAAALPEGTAPLELAFLPKVHGVTLRFTGFSLDATEAERRFAEIRRALRDVLAPWTFHADSGDLAEAVSAALRSADLTVAVAESCTGGLIAKRLTDLPGASDVFVGGLVAYSNELKVDLLGVTRTVLQEGGAVSEAVARQMALGVSSLLGAGAGIGITGVAGPTGGTVDKPVGTVWFAAAVGPRVVARGERFPGDRGAVRERSAQAALFLLLRLLEGRVEG